MDYTVFNDIPGETISDAVQCLKSNDNYCRFPRICTSETLHMIYEALKENKSITDIGISQMAGGISSEITFYHLGLWIDPSVDDAWKIIYKIYKLKKSLAELRLCQFIVRVTDSVADSVYISKIIKLVRTTKLSILKCTLYKKTTIHKLIKQNDSIIKFDFESTHIKDNRLEWITNIPKLVESIGELRLTFEDDVNGVVGFVDNILKANQLAPIGTLDIHCAGSIWELDDSRKRLADVIIKYVSVMDFVWLYLGKETRKLTDIFLAICRRNIHNRRQQLVTLMELCDS